MNILLQELEALIEEEMTSEYDVYRLGSLSNDEIYYYKSRYAKAIFELAKERLEK